MFEFDQAVNHGVALAHPELPFQSASDVSQMSLLIWGEHCIECAAPACFKTCDLYDRRPDSRCRRFGSGARRNRSFKSLRGYGVEIEFKKWAKVEARGNTKMASARLIRTLERGLEFTAPLLNLAGKIAYGITRDQRFRWVAQSLGERLCRAIHRRRSSSAEPSCFLLEVYNPGASALRFSLSITPAVRQNRLISILSNYQTTLVMPPGYSRHELDYRLFSKVAGQEAFDISLTPEGDEGGRLVFLTADFVIFAARQQVAEQQQIKCVVWDLDNTVWDGVLLEGAQPRVRPEVLKLIRFLDERGILLSVASKNDSDSGVAALRAAGIADYFLYSQINWEPKSQNLRRIAEALNIGLDTFAFIDDNPFEREEVGSVLPNVLCIDAVDVAQLAADPRFQGSTSSEARSRRRLYQEAIQRQEEEQRYGSDYLGFLRTCGIQLEISPYTPDDFDRAAELVQRTNQLNFSGKKYTRQQLFEVLDDASVEKYVLRCSDKYGSYGTIGFALVRSAPHELFVEDFMVSCRVQGKFLEQAFFAHILAAHNPHHASQIRVNYKQTAKNTPARKVLETIGFTPNENVGMSLDARIPLECDFILVACLGCGPELKVAALNSGGIVALDCAGSPRA